MHATLSTQVAAQRSWLGLRSCADTDLGMASRFNLINLSMAVGAPNDLIDVGRAQSAGNHSG